MEDLKSYLHPLSLPYIKYWTQRFDVKIILTKICKTRMGVFIPKNKNLNVIRINRDQNRYRFLITLIHELSHASVWIRYKNSVRPHGVEWQEEFRVMMQPFLNETFFPRDILNVLIKHLDRPLSSTCRDHILSEILMNHDKCNKKTFIKDLDDGHVFRTLDGRLFKRISKLRKNYKCIEMSTNIEYRFPPFIQIVLL